MAAIRKDESARRAFWRISLDAGYDFMMSARPMQVDECLEKPVGLKESAEEAGVEAAFSQTKIGGRFDRIFALREGLISSYIAAAREINEQGWILKVEDGYRTWEMQRSLALDEIIFEKILRKVIWERGGKTPPADILFKRVSVLVATLPANATHMSASAMDISVLNRDDGTEVWRGGPYLEMSELTPMNSPFVSKNCRENRRRITAIMERHGFMAFPYEFWHYSSGDVVAHAIRNSEEPAGYGPIEWIPSENKVIPIDRMKPINTEETIREIMMKVMDGIGRA